MKNSGSAQGVSGEDPDRGRSFGSDVAGQDLMAAGQDLQRWPRLRRRTFSVSSRSSISPALGEGSTLCFLNVRCLDRPSPWESKTYASRAMTMLDDDGVASGCAPAVMVSRGCLPSPEAEGSRARFVPYVTS
jgi:hypothetical protein